MSLAIMPTKPRLGILTPELKVATLDGKIWQLAEQTPPTLTAIIIYRGLHCPLCKAYLKDLNQKTAEFTQRGIIPIAISMETKERSEQIQSEWGLNNLTIGYGLPETMARNWGLYFSRGAFDSEPPLFSEPALFLVKPDGILHHVAIIGRPTLAEVLKGLGYVLSRNYSIRGMN
jgi:peroxiredoxin